MQFAKTAFLACILIGGLAVPSARPDAAEHVAAAKLTDEAIFGAWRLVSVDYSGPNGSLVYPVFGPNPQGVLIYDRSGWMSVQIVTANRPDDGKASVANIRCRHG
jgi:hypothetical protein